MRTLFGSLLLAFCAASVVQGQAEVHLLNGAVLQGRLTEDDGEKVKVSLIAEGATGATATYRHDQLAPITIYRLRFNKIERDDVKGQIDLASYALDNGVFPSARLSYDLAKKANEAKKGGMEKDLEKLHDRAPSVAFTFAQKAIDAKDYLRAERILSRICELFPDSTEVIHAARMLDLIAPNCGVSRQEAIEKKPGGSSKTAKDAAAPAKKQYDKAHETRRKALGETKNPTQATRQLEAAIEEFRSAQKLLDSAMKKEGGDSDLAAHYEAWTEKVKEDMAGTYVDIANLYFSRQSNKNAMDAVDQALLLDKKNSEALTLRAHIQVAMSDSNRWRW
jgi:tetratricopeptide (TPR) repeat protein